MPQEVPFNEFNRYGELFNILIHPGLLQVVNWGTPQIINKLSQIPSDKLTTSGHLIDTEASITNIREITDQLEYGFMGYEFRKGYKTNTGSSFLLTANTIDPVQRNHNRYSVYFRRTSFGKADFKHKYAITMGIRCIGQPGKGRLKEEDGLELYLGSDKNIVMMNSKAEAFRLHDYDLVWLQTNPEITNDPNKRLVMNQTTSDLWGKIIDLDLIDRRVIDGFRFPEMPV